MPTDGAQENKKLFLKIFFYFYYFIFNILWGYTPRIVVFWRPSTGPGGGSRSIRGPDIGAPTQKEGGDRVICDEFTKEERITKENRRLNIIFRQIPKKEKSAIEGLIKRAAYMRVSLEDMELDLDENGFTEPFTQSTNTPPYDRQRPIAQLYNTMNKNYQAIMKQLSDSVPKEPATERGDGFDKFIRER